MASICALAVLLTVPKQKRSYFTLLHVRLRIPLRLKLKTCWVHTQISSVIYTQINLYN